MKIVGLAGWSGAGKTTLLVEIIELLTVRGLSVSTVKHARHAFREPTEVADRLLRGAAPLSKVLARPPRCDLASLSSESG